MAQVGNRPAASLLETESANAINTATAHRQKQNQKKTIDRLLYKH